jgi:hypothetical protein
LTRLAGQQHLVPVNVRQKIELGNRQAQAVQTQVPYVHRVSAFLSHNAF